VALPRILRRVHHDQLGREAKGIGQGGHRERFRLHVETDQAECGKDIVEETIGQEDDDGHDQPRVTGGRGHGTLAMMATVSVRLFAALRELAGDSRVQAEGRTVGEVVSSLSERYGERFDSVARAGSVVVNGERASEDRPLAGGEEVALLPPVSGGA
jgi:MoaD family protein